MGHSATLLPSGKVLIAGGGRITSPGAGNAMIVFELYDLELGSTVLQGMCPCSEGHTATALLDGNVLIVGSQGSSVLFNPSSESFTASGRMTSTRRGATATLLDDGQVLVTGGFAGAGESSTFFDSTELYDPGTGIFSVGPSMTAPRREHTATVLPGGLVLVVGGSSGLRGTELTSSELFYP